MKVAQINFCDNGSTGKICKDISSFIGDENKIYVFKKVSDKDNIIKINSFLSHQIHRVLAGIFDKDELGSYFATKHFVKILKKENYDIIHLHNIHGYYLNYRVLFNFLKKNNVKTVWTLHDCWSFTGHCAYFDKINCNKWQKSCHNCPNLKNYPRTLFFDRSKKLFELKKKAFVGIKDMVLVTPSIWLNNLVKQSFLKDYTVNVINNGINLDNFFITNSFAFGDIIDKNKKVILGVANPWTDRKGYSDLYKLREQLDENYQIVAVGVDDNQYNDLKKSDIIPIKRTENQKQLAELYSNADVFINLTYEDNFPTVNLEALACGCPIITYRTGGSVEVITDENGAVVSQGNISELSEKIKEFCNKQFNRDNISKTAKEKYNSQKMAMSYQNIYKELYK